MAWEVVTEKTYDEWYTFSGDYTQVVATFKTAPEQLTWMLTNPIGEWLGDHIRNHALASGVTPLYYRLMKNVDPTWTTDWQIDLWASQDSPLHIGMAAWIIIGALTAVGIAYFSLQWVSETQATKRAEIAYKSEQAKIAFVEEYEPEYGAAVFDWLKDISTVPESVKQSNPTLWDDIGKLLPTGIGTGVLLIAGAVVLLLLLRR